MRVIDILRRKGRSLCIHTVHKLPNNDKQYSPSFALKDLSTTTTTKMNFLGRFRPTFEF